MTAKRRPDLTLADLAKGKDWVSGVLKGAEAIHDGESEHQRKLGNHRLADHHALRAAEYRHQREERENADK